MERLYEELSFFELQKRLNYINMILDISNSDLWERANNNLKTLNFEKGNIEREIANRKKFNHILFRQEGGIK